MFDFLFTSTVNNYDICGKQLFTIRNNYGVTYIIVLVTWCFTIVDGCITFVKLIFIEKITSLIRYCFPYRRLITLCLGPNI